MGSLIFVLAYLLMAGVIAFGVKYGIIWAIRTLSDDELAKIAKSFKR